jgi:hypothetical protein
MADEIELLRLVSELIPEPTTDAWVRAQAAIAAVREEDSLRQDTERTTRDLQAPAGMTRRVGWRRRRLALVSAGAVAAALAAGAAALAAAGIPGAHHNGTEGPAVATAYVVQRVDRALSAAEPTEIGQMTVTTISSSAGSGGKTVAAITEEWSYDGQRRSITYSSAGHPVGDWGFSTSSVYTVVSYPARTWARGRESGGSAAPPPASGSGGSAAPPPASGSGGCERAVRGVIPVTGGLPDTGFSVGSPHATVAGALRAAVSCGTMAVTGRQRVDGIEALELTSRPAGSQIFETIWVSPDTYLPVRTVVRSVPGTPLFQLTADVTWLPPTAQNLARLTVPIPAGFRQVPLAELVTPTSPAQAPTSG